MHTYQTWPKNKETLLTILAEWQEPSANTDRVLGFVDESIILSMLVFVQVISHRGLPFNPTQTDIINPHSPARHTRFAKCASLYQTSDAHTRFAQAVRNFAALIAVLSCTRSSLLPRSKQNLQPPMEKRQESLSSCAKKNNHACTPTDWLNDWLPRRTLCNLPGRGRGKYAWEPRCPPVYLGAHRHLTRGNARVRVQCNCTSKLAVTRVYCNLFRGQWSRVLSGFTCQRGQIVQNCALCATKTLGSAYWKMQRAWQMTLCTVCCHA